MRATNFVPTTRLKWAVVTKMNDHSSRSHAVFSIVSITENSIPIIFLLLLQLIDLFNFYLIFSDHRVQRYTCSRKISHPDRFPQSSGLSLARRDFRPV